MVNAQAFRQNARRSRLRIGVLATLILWSVAGQAGPDFDKLDTIALQRYGQAAVQTTRQWQDLFQQLRKLDDLEKLQRVNEFFNRRIRFLDDREIWGKNDYWATPLETMGKGAGDCEDFSVAKYMTLKSAGIPVDKMRLIYVRAAIGGPQSQISQPHMVLGYYPTPESEPLILDNLITDIRTASRRPDLSPVFTFNSEGLWVGSAATGPAASATARLSRWRDVLTRMREEGLD